jgi:hypothetical protein
MTFSFFPALLFFSCASTKPVRLPRAQCAGAGGDLPLLSALPSEVRTSHGVRARACEEAILMLRKHQK